MAVQETGPNADPRDTGAEAAPQERERPPRGAGQVFATGGSVRVDSWIWCARLTRTRSLAATACRGGHVKINGERVKPAQALRVGDEVRLFHAGRERVVIVAKLLGKRVGAPVAAESYVDNSPPPPPRQDVLALGLRDRGAGRPTKRDRRELERLRLLGPSRRAPG
ncbi:RNA-binding S4 domain-containing protein [Streptomyces sp. NBC_01190]|uniref:RNA-binding S4 domain-containing protein n=1 Tax=Streptomyces sp. NBC_01190 TaxID=2903767 RepID=UPI0038646E68|nr:RNA-binding S4 domain-containing protein [Streptomyces sp. NBC_01190]